MSEAADSQRPVRGSRWADDRSRDALHAIAESFAEVSGFAAVTISVVREDGYVHVLAVVGPEDARAKLLDQLAPLDLLDAALAVADDWGFFKFVPHERPVLDPADWDKWGWRPSLPEPDAPGEWHPDDMLLAPLHDGDGELIAILGLDLPRDGRVPDAARQALLEANVPHTARAIVATLERERLAEQIRLAGAAADIVRRASASMAAHDVLAACGAEIVDGFRAKSLWSRLRGEEPRAVVDPTPMAPPPDVLELMERYAEAAWTSQEVGIFAPDRQPPPPLDADEARAVLDFMAAAGGESLLLVPLGAGQEWMGWIGLSRGRGGAEWSQAEAVVALDIGRDLGQALASARTFEREHELVRELQEIADYKSHLVATVSHELRTPLTSIVGFLEVLEDDPSLAPGTRSAITAIQRGSARLVRVVEQLLELHRSADAVVDTDQVVDLVPLLREVVELHDDMARRQDLTLVLDVPDDPVTVTGLAHELQHIAANLVGNAVKYTPTGGRVELALTRAEGQAVLTCTDTGIGIAAEEQAHVFDEFFRSHDPDAWSKSGSGLGLAIVRRLVERHHGRVEVESTLGAGSVFRVRLPLA